MFDNFLQHREPVKERHGTEEEEGVCCSGDIALLPPFHRRLLNNLLNLGPHSGCLNGPLQISAAC